MADDVTSAEELLDQELDGVKDKPIQEGFSDSFLALVWSSQQQKSFPTDNHDVIQYSGVFYNRAAVVAVLTEVDTSSFLSLLYLAPAATTTPRAAGNHLDTTFDMTVDGRLTDAVNPDNINVASTSKKAQGHHQYCLGINSVLPSGNNGSSKACSLLKASSPILYSRSKRPSWIDSCISTSGSRLLRFRLTERLKVSIVASSVTPINANKTRAF
jgi:hypothetical protein